MPLWVPVPASGLSKSGLPSTLVSQEISDPPPPSLMPIVCSGRWSDLARPLGAPKVLVFLEEGPDMRVLKEEFEAGYRGSCL